MTAGACGGRNDGASRSELRFILTAFVALALASLPTTRNVGRAAPSWRAPELLLASTIRVAGRASTAREGAFRERRNAGLNMRPMQTNISSEGISRAGSSLEHLSDAELLDGTRRLVGRSNQLLSELLLHPGEEEARGIPGIRACSSLSVYCIYELRFSEDEAFRRVAAARLVRRFPALLDALAAGELHLTGLLMLGPHLTEANLAHVLARAKHRTKRELARLVRMLDPLPAVPARIEPLGPAPARWVPREPTWQEFMDSTCPVRELAPGDRPRDWTESANDTVPR